MGACHRGFEEFSHTRKFIGAQSRRRKAAQSLCFNSIVNIIDRTRPWSGGNMAQAGTEYTRVEGLFRVLVADVDDLADFWGDFAEWSAGGEDCGGADFF